MSLSFKHSYVFLLAFLLIFGLQSVAAQDKEWRQVSPAELQMTTPKVEADADAEAIFWEVRIDDSSSEELSMRHYVRVKIFTERGRERFSKFDIPFTKGIKIKDIAARVIKADGTIVEITPKDIFEREIIRAGKVKIKAKSFAIPNIEPGVIVEYRYKEVIDDAGALGMELEFQKDIPVQTLAYYYKPYNKRDPDAQSYNFNDTRFVKNEKGYYLAQRSNIPAFREEPRMPPKDTVRPWMQLQGVRINLTAVSGNSIYFSIKDPSNMGQYWASVAGEKVSLVNYMLKPDKEIKKLAMELTAGVSSDEEKLRKLYEYCQTQVKNVTYDPTATEDEKLKSFKQKNLSDVIKMKYTDAGFLNIFFGSMASSLGFDTRIAFSGNRSKMIFDPRMTNESFIHRGPIAIQVGNDWKFFDPGKPFVPFGMLAWFEEDVWSLVVGERQNAWVKTPMTGTDKSLSKRSAKFKLDADGNLEGDVRIEFNGQAAVANRVDIYDVSPAQREENIKAELKQRISAAEVSSIVIENITEVSKPLVYSYKVRVPNYAQKTGKRLFLQPGFFEYGTNPLFASANRKYDIYFPFPWAENDNVEITLPEGYVLDNADKPGEISDTGKIGRLKIDISVDKEETFINYRRQFHFGGGGNILFPADRYPQLKSLFDEFHKNDTHTITLKQK